MRLRDEGLCKPQNVLSASFVVTEVMGQEGKASRRMDRAYWDRLSNTVASIM